MDMFCRFLMAWMTLMPSAIWHDIIPGASIAFVLVVAFGVFILGLIASDACDALSESQPDACSVRIV